MRAAQRLPFHYLQHQGVRESAIPILGLLHYPWSVLYNAELCKEASRTIFEFLVWLDLRLNIGLSGPGEHSNHLPSGDKFNGISIIIEIICDVIIIIIKSWRLLRKARRKTDLSQQKQYWQHKDEQNDNNQKTKMGSKTIL